MHLHSQQHCRKSDSSNGYRENNAKDVHTLRAHCKHYLPQHLPSCLSNTELFLPLQYRVEPLGSYHFSCRADCAVCSDGYTASIGFNCDKCSGSAGGIILAIFLAGAAVFVVIVVAGYIVSGEQERTKKGLVERTMRYIPLQSLKIVIVAWQILTQVRIARCNFVISNC